MPGAVNFVFGLLNEVIIFYQVVSLSKFYFLLQLRGPWRSAGTVTNASIAAAMDFQAILYEFRSIVCRASMWFLISAQWCAEKRELYTGGKKCMLSIFGCVIR